MLTLTVRQHIARMFLSIFVLPIGLGQSIDLNELQTKALENTLELNLPQVHILPDSPFYGLKKNWEFLVILLAGTPEQKMNVLLDFAEIRLAEAVAMIKEQNQSKVEAVMQEYTDTIAKVNDIKASLEPQKIEQHIDTKLEVEQRKVELFELLAGEYKIEWTR